VTFPGPTSATTHQHRRRPAVAPRARAGRPRRDAGDGVPTRGPARSDRRRRDRYGLPEPRSDSKARASVGLVCRPRPRTADPGPDPRRTGRRRACPDPPGLHTRYHAPRSTHAGRLSITVVLHGTCSRMRGTRPQSRWSARTSGRARPIARDGREATYANCAHMRHARKYDLCMPQADHFHVCRIAQNAHKPIGHGPCGKPSSFAASRGPPRSTHTVPTAKCVSRPAQDRTHNHAVGALLLHACHECPRSHRALRALNRQTRRRPRRYPRRLSQLPDRHPGPVSIPATRPPPRNIRPVRQRPPAVRPHHCAARITRITRHPLSRQRHPPRS
jgi:hypothetical protein